MFIGLFVFFFNVSSEAENFTEVITASRSPSYAVRGQNLTLEFTYTLDGSFGSAKVAIVKDDGSESLIGKSFEPGILTIEPEYQNRFKAKATDTRVELTILTVQTSDEDTYRFNVLPTGVGSILKEVTLVVNGKY